MTIESTIESTVCNYAKKRGWFEAKIKSSNKRGMPDRIFHRQGLTIYIEFKAEGEEPNPQQLKRHRELQAQNIPVFVVDNVEAGCGILR